MLWPSMSSTPVFEPPRSQPWSPSELTIRAPLGHERGAHRPLRWAATELLGWGSLTYLFVRVPANAAAGPGAPVPVRALPPDAVAGHDEGLSPAGQDHRARPRLRARLRRLTNYVTRSLLEAGGFGLAHTVDSEGPTLLTVTAMLAMSGP